VSDTSAALSLPTAKVGNPHCRMIRLSISSVALRTSSPRPCHSTMPTIDLTDEEHAAVTAAIRRPVEDDKFPVPRA
jgi:hypothetical protein